VHNTTAAKPSPVGRLHHLDSLRGIAAVVVMLHHWRDMFTVSLVPVYLVPVFAGLNSVKLFFVLSGFVLSLPYWSGRQSSYNKYLVRRICRIYLPYAGAVFFAVIIGSRLLNSSLPLTHWFYNTWHEPFTTKLVLQQLLFSNPRGAAINMAFWSLRIEMIMSLVFPFVCWILLRLPPVPCWALAFGLEMIALDRPQFIMDRILHGQTDFILYASAFLFGAVLAKYLQPIREIYQELNLPTKILLLGCVIAGFYRGGGLSNELSNIPACCGVIVLADCSGLRGWLSTRVPVYIGDISYSLYLLHGPVLLASIILLYGRVPLWAIFVTFMAVTFGISHLYFNWVEMPAMVLGKKLTANRTQPEKKADEALVSSISA
jgi:peptidoglycan/LPS O-acetylase OafA/YrhL